MIELSGQQLAQIEAEIARQPESVQKFYREVVAKGESPRFAAMVAMRSAPLTRYTDKTFGKKRLDVMHKMKPKMRDAYLDMAKKAGISTQGKYYVGGLGRPTDPMAWVSTVDDAKQVCKIKNLSAEGLVHNQGTQVDPPKKSRMAPDVQRDLVRRKLAQDPCLAEACAKDPPKLRRVAAAVVDQHARPCT